METFITASHANADRSQLSDAARSIGPLLSQYTDEEENNRRLSKPVVDAMKETGFLKLLLPKSLGGLEADPLTTALMVEEIAGYDTVAGWAMMVANTSAWWLSCLPEKGVEEAYQFGPDTVIAGAIHPPMQATPVPGGYHINGRTPLISNIHEAAWVFIPALVMEGDKIKMNNGVPLVIGALTKAEDCQIIDTWFTMGMRGTDSNDVTVKDIFVPDHRVLPLAPGLEHGTHYQGALYRFPAMGISAGCLIAPVALAVARNAINELKSLAEKKTPFSSAVPLRERASVQGKTGQAEALVQSARALLHQEISECWSKTLAGEEVAVEKKASLLLAAAHAVQSSARAVDLMYSAAGSTAIYTRSKLERYFRDAQVIRQHGLANESRYETAGQVFLGLPPDLPLLIF